MKPRPSALRGNRNSTSPADSQSIEQAPNRLQTGTPQSQVDTWVRVEVQAMTAYSVPAPGDAIKMDAMENPYTWPGALSEAWLQALSSVSLNRYPDAKATSLRDRLRHTLDLPSSTGLILGNGSDELIQMLMLTVGGPNRVVVSCEPTFVMYRRIAQATGLVYTTISLRDPDFSLDKAALVKLIAAERPAVVFIANPNNPTGNLFPDSVIEQVIEAAPGLVVIDEAYEPFSGTSFLDRIGEFSNLLIMRTLSKIGLAGLRVGLLVGPAPWLAEIDKVRLPYNLNTLSQVSAEFALDHYSLLEQQVSRICRDRDDLATKLAELDGVTVWPSHTNFILLRVPLGRAASVHATLKSRGILIKCLDGSHPLLADCLRVTVAAPEQNQAFLAALEAAL